MYEEIGFPGTTRNSLSTNSSYHKCDKTRFWGMLLEFLIADEHLVVSLNIIYDVSQEKGVHGFEDEGDEDDEDEDWGVGGKLNLFIQFNIEGFHFFAIS